MKMRHINSISLGNGTKEYCKSIALLPLSHPLLAGYPQIQPEYHDFSLEYAWFILYCCHQMAWLPSINTSTRISGTIFRVLQSYLYLTWVGVSKGFRPTSWAPSWPLIVKSSPLCSFPSQRDPFFSKMVVKRSGTNSTEYCDCYVFISSKLCL